MKACSDLQRANQFGAEQQLKMSKQGQGVALHEFDLKGHRGVEPMKAGLNLSLPQQTIENA